MSTESNQEEPARASMGDSQRTNVTPDGAQTVTGPQSAQPHGMIGRRFAHYVIKKELGHGGQGYVFLAEDEKLHRQVAIKILHNLQALNPKMRMRFEREAEAASKITHPGICAVHEFGEFEGMPFIAMQYVEGVPLSTRITSIQQSGSATTSFIDFETTQGVGDEARPARREDKTNTSGTASESTPSTRDRVVEIVEMIESVARALHAAHEQNLVHRDIKPANIIINSEGTPVILDFGLARDSESDAATLTQSGDLMGTPVYMSPEQVAGHRIRVDRRSDVYSLGVTLYECLTLQRPFEAPTRERLFQAILTKEPVDAAKINRSIPNDLQVVIQTAMAKDPDRRYQTALVFADDLRAVCEFRPISAKPVSVLGRVVRWSRRNPARAALIAVLVLGLPLVTGLLGYIRANQPQLEKQALAERDERVEGHLERGFYELHHGSTRKALLAFKAGLDEHENSVESSLGYAMALVRMQRPEEALDELNRIGAVMDDPSILNPVKIDALRSLGRKDEADTLREEKAEPDSMLGWFVSGTRALQRGERLPSKSAEKMRAFRYAEACLLRANQTSPRRRRAFLFQLAHVVGHTKNVALGRPLAESIEHLWPDSAMALFWAAFAYCQQDVEKEIELYEKIVKLDPAWGMVRKNYALALGNVGRLEEGIEQYKETRRLAPSMTGVDHDIGVLLMRQKKFEEAIESFKKAIELKDTVTRSRTKLGQCYEFIGQPEKAEEVHRKAIELNPANAMSLAELGRFHFARKEYPEAIAFLRQAVNQDPGLHVSWSNLGAALSNSGELEEAVQAFEKALALEPDYYGCYINLGNTYNRLNRRHEANAAFRKALQFNPKNIALYRKIAFNYMKMNLYDEGLKCYERAIAIQPDDAQTLDDLAWYLVSPQANVKLRNLKKGLEYSKKAVALTKRKNALLLSTLALALYESKRIPEAIEVQEEAVEICQTDKQFANYLKPFKETLKRYEETPQN